MKYKIQEDLQKSRIFNSPRYCEIFLLIFQGHNTNSKIRNLIQKYSPQQVSNRLKWLRDFGLITNKRLRSFNRNSTSRNFIHYDGVIEFLFQYFLDVKNVPGTASGQGPKIEYQNPLLEQALKFYFSSLINSKPPGLFDLFDNFIDGYGLSFFNRYIGKSFEVKPGIQKNITLNQGFTYRIFKNQCIDYFLKKHSNNLNSKSAIIFGALNPKEFDWTIQNRK